MRNSTIRNIREDIEHTTKIMNALEEYADGREFSTAELAEADKVIRKQQGWWGTCKDYITGSTMMALVNRGLAVVTGSTKCYVPCGETRNGRQMYIEGTANKYRIVGTIEEYKQKALLEVTDALLMG